MVNMCTKFDKETSNGVQKCSLYRIHKVHARTEPRTDGLTDGTTAALLYPQRNALRGDNIVSDEKRPGWLFSIGVYLKRSNGPRWKANGCI